MLPIGNGGGAADCDERDGDEGDVNAPEGDAADGDAAEDTADVGAAACDAPDGDAAAACDDDVLGVSAAKQPHCPVNMHDAETLNSDTCNFVTRLVIFTKS